MIDSFVDSIDVMLITTGFTTGVMVIKTIILPFHFCLCYTLIHTLDWGFNGAAWASNITVLVTLIIEFSYALSLTQLKDAWYWPTMKTF